METGLYMSALGMAKSTILSVSNQQNSNHVNANHANQSGQEHHEWNPPSFEKEVRTLCCIHYTDLCKKIQQKLFEKRAVFAFFTKDERKLLLKLVLLHTEESIER